MTESVSFSPSPSGDHTLIVIPTYNEMSTLPTILGDIWANVPDAHVLIVDDSSPDGTGEWVDTRRESEERLHVLHRPAKSGLATAYVDGMGWGIDHGYPFILQMDADGSHRPVDLPKLLSRMAGPDRPDLVIGSRWVPGGTINGCRRSASLCPKRAIIMSVCVWARPCAMRRQVYAYTEHLSCANMRFSVG